MMTGGFGLGIEARRRWRAVALVGAVAVAAAIGGCNGYDPRDELVKHVQKPLPGTDQPYPNLASVPEAPPPTTPKEKRVELQQKLTQDNQSTTYSPDVGRAPQIPPAPSALPESFLTASAPVKAPSGLARQAPPVAQLGSTPSLTRPSSGPLSPPGGAPDFGAPDFGALSRPNRVAAVLFDAGSAVVDPTQAAELKPIVALLHQRGGVLQVVGYASHPAGESGGAGEKIADLGLSLERANAVARVLQRLGARPAELVVTAQGRRPPALPIEGGEGDAASQRADIFIEY